MNRGYAPVAKEPRARQAVRSFTTACYDRATGSSSARYSAAMGKRRPTPNAFDVIFSPGAACRRLYSLSVILRTMSSTTSRSSPERDDRRHILVALDVGLDYRDR